MLETHRKPGSHWCWSIYWGVYGQKKNKSRPQISSQTLHISLPAVGSGWRSVNRHLSISPPVIQEEVPRSQSRTTMESGDPEERQYTGHSKQLISVWGQLSIKSTCHCRCIIQGSPIVQGLQFPSCPIRSVNVRVLQGLMGHVVPQQLEGHSLKIPDNR